MINKSLIILTVALIAAGCSSSRELEDLKVRVAQLESEARVSQVKSEESSDKNDVKVSMLLGQLSAASYNGFYTPNKEDILIALGLMKEKSAVPHIIAVAKSSDNNHFRSEAHKVLGWIGDKRAVKYLESAIKNDSYLYARQHAAYSLQLLTGDKKYMEEFKRNNK